MKKTLIIILLAVMVIGIFGALSPGRENILIPASPKPLSEATLEEDGKEIIQTVDFDVDWTPPSSGVNHTSSIGTVALKAGTFESDADAFSFIIDAGATGGEPFAVFNGTYSLEQYSVVMYDVDVLVSEGYSHQIGMRPVFMNSSGKSDVINSGLVRYQNGGFRWFNGATFKTGIDDTFHYTFIVYPEGRVLVYVDGELLLNAEAYSMFSEDCTYIQGFRITTVGVTDTKKNVATFSNLQVSVFAKDYEGRIFDLLENPDVSLYTNIDTILGGSDK